MNFIFPSESQGEEPQSQYIFINKEKAPEDYRECKYFNCNVNLVTNYLVNHGVDKHPRDNEYSVWQLVHYMLSNAMLAYFFLSNYSYARCLLKICCPLPSGLAAHFSLANYLISIGSLCREYIMYNWRQRDVYVFSTPTMPVATPHFHSLACSSQAMYTPASHLGNQNAPVSECRTAACIWSDGNE